MIWVMLGLQFGCAVEALLAQQPGKFTYWVGAFILTLGVNWMKG